MENCLLCLDQKKEHADCINIISNETQELDVKNIVEKHLWSMNYMTKSSWLCTLCWRELYEFHKFYLRIEQVHIEVGLLLKNVTEEKETWHNETTEELEESPIDDLKDFLNEYDLSDNHLEEDSITIEEQKSLIKDELNEDQEQANDDVPLLQRRRRGRPRKEHGNVAKVAKDSLSKTKKCKQHKIKEDIANGIDKAITPINKTRSCKQSEHNETLNNDTDNISQIKEEPNGLPKVEESSNSLENHDNDSNLNDDSDDRESLEHIDSTPNISDTPKTKRNDRDKFLEENFKITCFLCNIPMKSFFSMCKHFEEKHNERGHVKCCNKKFYRRSVLVDHVHRHLDPNYFKCKQCGKVMADRRCLELHLEMHEGTAEKNHCCDICGKGFAKIGVLKKHRMIHLSEEEKRFPCSECGKNFGTNYLLSSHYRSVHLKKYVKICDICGKSIRCKDVFERHMLQHEGKSAPTVSCDVCGLRLTDNKALKRHKDMIHPVGGKQEYTCSICSKISPNLKAHKRHVQYKHVMGYDHKCTICEKAFKRAQTLREHMASHTGTILYTCPWCPKTFNSNANMHNHRKRVHPKEWEETSRNRYSGNLPPNFKPPTITQATDFSVPIDM